MGANYSDKIPNLSLACAAITTTYNISKIVYIPRARIVETYLEIFHSVTILKAFTIYCPMRTSLNSTLFVSSEYLHL